MEKEKDINQSNSKNKTRKISITNNFLEHGKLPPQALDLEETVLGAMLLEKNALTAVIEKLKPEVFYHDSHKEIFSAIKKLFANSEPVDILTVINELKKKGTLDIVGGPYYITQLTNRVATGANIEYHTGILIEKYLLRELIQYSSDIIKEAYNSSTDAFNLLDRSEQFLFELTEGNIRSEHSDMHSLVRRAIDEIEKAKKFDSHLTGIASGFTSLDRVTSGWQKSNLVVIAGRPGMGKTAFVLSMARNMAVDRKIPIAFFSLEMSSVELVMRLISSESHLPGQKLKSGKLEDYEWTQLNTKIKTLINAPLYIDDTPAISMFDLRVKSRWLKAQHGIEAIVVDYLQLMSSDGDKRSNNREQEISTISRSLKALAKELELPIITLSQLSRETEKRGSSKVPQLSDLRESGAIEQDADMVIFIYRPEYYGFNEFTDNTPAAGLAEIRIAKHRNGPIDNVKLRFVNNLVKFEDIEDLEITEVPDELIPNENFEAARTTVKRQSKINGKKSGNTDDNPF